MRGKRKGGAWEGAREGEVRGVRPGVTAGSRWTVQRSGEAGRKENKAAVGRRRRDQHGHNNNNNNNKNKKRLKDRGIKGKR